METSNNKNPIYKVKRGEMNPDEKDIWAYDKVLYRTVITTNYPITLVGLSFFGPAKGTKPVKYEVEYEICHAIRPVYYFCKFFKRSNVPDPVIQKGKKIITATPKENFYVDLGRVGIPANTRIEIAFCLEGPETRRMKNPKTSLFVDTKSRQVAFELTRGSFQMPEIYFVMEEDNDPSRTTY